jgi:hypothetical protein
VADLVRLGQPEDVEHQAPDPADQLAAEGDQEQDARGLREADHPEGRLEVAARAAQEEQQQVDDPRGEEHADDDEHAPEHDLRHESDPALDPAEEGRELRPLPERSPGRAHDRAEDRLVEGRRGETHPADHDGVEQRRAEPAGDRHRPEEPVGSAGPARHLHEGRGGRAVASSHACPAARPSGRGAARA